MIIPESLYQLTERDLAGKLASEFSLSAVATDTQLIVEASILIPNPDRQLLIIDTLTARAIDGSNGNRCGLLVYVSTTDGAYGNGHELLWGQDDLFTINVISQRIGNLQHDLILGVHPDITLTVQGTFLQAVVGNSVQLSIHGWAVAPGSIYS